MTVTNKLNREGWSIVARALEATEIGSMSQLSMKSLLVLYSYHHKNTEKVAKAFAEVLNAQIKTSQQTNPQELQEYDLVGFGAGIAGGKHYKPLLDFADRLLPVNQKNSFIFSTAALTGEKKTRGRPLNP